MNEKLRELNVEFLFSAILKLETMEECYNFFEDLCTMPELKALSQRIQVAKMLSEKKVYSDIVAETGASTATISRVKRSAATAIRSFLSGWTRRRKPLNNWYLPVEGGKYPQTEKTA